VEHTQLGPREVAEAALRIAASLDVYTNETLSLEEISAAAPGGAE
jgi:ATP-dependent protease HslVU (ClpYQ) peptidase subunit